MTKENYLKLRGQFSAYPSFIISMAILGAIAAYTGISISLIRQGYFIGQFLLGIAAFQWFAIVHECGHGTFSRYRGLNSFVGHIASLFCLLPYNSWKYIHQEHHRWSGNIDQDPTLQGLKKIQEGMKPLKKTLLEKAWHYWIPVIASNQHFLIWKYGLKMKNRSQRFDCLASSLLIIGFHLLFPFPFLPALIVFLVITELVNAPHHLGFAYSHGPNKLNLWEQDSVTRSGYYPGWISEFLFLNFNLHVEHHLFPHLPWYLLRRVRKTLCSQASHSYLDTAGFQWVRDRRRRSFFDLNSPVIKPAGIKNRKRTAIRLLGKVIPFLPQSWRHEIYRRSIELNYELSPKLKIKLATTKEEYEAAFRLLYDSYVKTGLMEENPWHVRITKYHALPTTTIIVALWEDKVVGTLSIVQDNPMGLPMECCFDLGGVRKKQKRIAEISALAIDPEFRGQAGKVIFPITKYMWEYASRYIGLETLVIAVHPRMADFYQAILLMDKVCKKDLDDYAFANHKPAVGLILDFEKAQKRGYEVYCGRKKKLDLYRYYQSTQFPQFEYPDRSYFRGFDSNFNVDLIHHFFQVRTQIWPTLTEKEQKLILEKTKRYRTCLVGNAQNKGEKIAVRFRDVSETGFCIDKSSDVLPTHLNVAFKISQDEQLELKANEVWSREGRSGFKITEAPPQWNRYIHSLSAA